MAFTCPTCLRTSHHPEDERQGYCAGCGTWTPALDTAALEYRCRACQVAFWVPADHVGSVFCSCGDPRPMLPLEDGHPVITASRIEVAGFPVQLVTDSRRPPGYIEVSTSPFLFGWTVTGFSEEELAAGERQLRERFEEPWHLTPLSDWSVTLTGQLDAQHLALFGIPPADVGEPPAQDPGLDPYGNRYFQLSTGDVRAMQEASEHLRRDAVAWEPSFFDRLADGARYLLRRLGRLWTGPPVPDYQAPEPARQPEVDDLPWENPFEWRADYCQGPEPV